jgi:hypothetical protein
MVIINMWKALNTTHHLISGSHRASLLLFTFINQLGIILLGTRNNIIKQNMNVTRSLLEDIKSKQLQCYGKSQSNPETGLRGLEGSGRIRLPDF